MKEIIQTAIDFIVMVLVLTMFFWLATTFPYIIINRGIT